MLLSQQEDALAIKLNIFTYLYMSYGIPVFYYGTETGFSGGNDPEN
jgi:glycosidase